MRRSIIDAQCRREPDGGAVRRHWKAYEAAGPLEELCRLERAVYGGRKEQVEKALMCLSDQARVFLASARDDLIRRRIFPPFIETEERGNLRSIHASADLVARYLPGAIAKARASNRKYIVEARSAALDIALQIYRAVSGCEAKVHLDRRQGIVAGPCASFLRGLEDELKVLLFNKHSLDEFEARP